MKNPVVEEEYRDFSKRIWIQSTVNHLPTRVQFEITYRCNIHCLHCYTDPFNNPQDLRRELTFEEILHLFDQLADAGVLWMLLTGGEAVVHPKFRQIYQEAKARGFIVSLFSNGTTLTEAMAEFLAQDPPFQIEVSCHGASPETFDKITQIPGSHKRFQEGVHRILERRLPLKIKTKGMSLNRQELPEIKAWVENLGLDFNLYTKIYPRLNGDLSSTQYRLSAEEIVELEFGEGETSGESDERCLEADSEPDFKRQLNPPPNNRLFRCGCGTNSLTISPYGILRACTFTTWPAYDLKTMSVKEAFEQLVKEIRQARYAGESPCKSCLVHTLCDKNPVMALHEAGSMEAPVPHFCDVAYGRAAKLAGVSKS